VLFRSAKPFFKFVPLKEKPKHLLKGTDWSNAYRLGVLENEERNRAVVRYASLAKLYGIHCMILVNRKDHGRHLLAELTKLGIKADFIFGENEQDERQAALRALAKGDLDCLIGSTILDVGVDVPAVGMMILAGGGKAEIAHRQRIGRGLRSKKGVPNCCFVVDFEDPYNKHLAKHAAQRREIVATTPGFAEGILSPGVDFDFTGFSQKSPSACLH
jgi:superfamily II DNA or RNA helicase